MIKVTSEINPCQSPIQKFAGSSAVNFSFPGAQEVTNKRTTMNNGTHLKSFNCFILILVFGYFYNDSQLIEFYDMTLQSSLKDMTIAGKNQLTSEICFYILSSNILRKASLRLRETSTSLLSVIVTVPPSPRLYFLI